MLPEDPKKPEAPKEPTVSERVQKLRDEIPARGGVYHALFAEIVELVAATLPKK